MLASAASELFGSYYGEQTCGGSYKVPDFEPEEDADEDPDEDPKLLTGVTVIAERSRVATSRAEEPPTERGIMHTLPWRADSRPASIHCAILLAVCSLQGSFVAEVPDPFASEDELSDDFKSFAGLTLRQTDKFKGRVEEVYDQALSLSTEDANNLTHTVVFQLFMEGRPPKKWAREWRIQDTVNTYGEVKGGPVSLDGDDGLIISPRLTEEELAKLRTEGTTKEPKPKEPELPPAPPAPVANAPTTNVEGSDGGPLPGEPVPETAALNPDGTPQLNPDGPSAPAPAGTPPAGEGSSPA